MIKLQTSEFQKAVTKVEKGAGKNALLPITEMIGIKIKDNTMSIYATDGANDMKYIINDVNSDDISITVKAETLAKLMNKVTSEIVELNVTEDYLEIKANGTYKLPLEVDENGVIDFPEIKFNIPDTELNATTHTNVLSAIAVNKSALSVDYTKPELTGYYVGDCIMTSDQEVITKNDIWFSKDESEPMLINEKMMYLLSLAESEEIKFYRQDGKLYFFTDKLVVCGAEMAEIEDFPIDILNTFIETEFNSSCKIPKLLLIDVLERLQIFIESYDENGAIFTFTDDGLNISSKKSSSIEIIKYNETNEFKPYTCTLNIPKFKELLKSNPSDTITIHYGNDNAIKITTDKVTQILAVMGE